MGAMRRLAYSCLVRSVAKRRRVGRVDGAVLGSRRRRGSLFADAIRWHRLRGAAARTTADARDTGRGRETPARETESAISLALRARLAASRAR
jgi:hypothetical protein